MTVVTFDPTDREAQLLSIVGAGNISNVSWRSAEDRAGSRLIAELQKLHLTVADELRVVVGPGGFTSVRIAALVGNAVNLLTGVQLFARNLAEKDWQAVAQLQPFYAELPRITPAKKI